MKIAFHGGIREIGGSCTTVETRDAKISLDYGIKIGDNAHHDLPKDLDAVLISHAHLDHTGSLLELTDSNVTIIGLEATREITAELLQDQIKVQQINDTTVPYDKNDVNKVKKLWWARRSSALPGMEIQLYHAGHVLGASMISIKTEEKTILYTGDFCLHDTEILQGSPYTELPKNPDVLIMESTYGGEIMPERTTLLQRFFSEIHRAMEKKGNILIPVFAFHRSQEMAKRIDEAMKLKALPHYNVYYISTLGYKITKYFNRYKDLLKQEMQSEEEPFNYQYVKSIMDQHFQGKRDNRKQLWTLFMFQNWYENYYKS